MTARRSLAKRRKALGYSQESFAEAAGTDRSTVGRWERGESEPQPFIWPKLARLLQVGAKELEVLLTREMTGGRAQPPSLPAPTVIGGVVPEPDRDTGELDEMNRRELLRLLSVAGTLVTIPRLEIAPDATRVAQAAEASEIEQYQMLNAHLWQVFSLSKSKRLVYPLVRQQLSLLTDSLDRAHSEAAHKQLCLLAGDLFQLAGEICFDANRYTDAAYCYTLAADASKEAQAYDLWACALTRHAFIGMYERRFSQASSVLAAAERVAQLGDSSLSTRYWVAAVQAEAFAGLGDLGACNRALDTAERVLALTGAISNGGWLRFDGSRLAEERGTCYLELERADLAEAALSDVLAQTISLRRRGSVLTDFAMLGVQRRDLDQVLEYGASAVDLAEQTRSAGYVGRKLQGLRTQLAPLMTDDRVSLLSDRIARLPGIAG